MIDADGRYLGKYRKHHIPHCHPGFWEKFYFTPGNAGYPVFRDALRQRRRLHLLRPPFSGRRADSRIERRGDRVQSLRDGGRTFRISLGTRAARSRRRQSIFCRGHQSRGNGIAVEHRRILRQELFLQSARENRGAGQPRQGRTGRCGSGSSTKSRKCATPGSSIATAGRKPTAKSRAHALQRVPKLRIEDVFSVRKLSCPNFTHADTNGHSR